MVTIRLPEFKKSSLEQFVIAGDWHFNHLDMPSYNILKKVLKDMGKPNLVINGDFFELEFLMFNKPEFRKWHNRGVDGVEYFLERCNEELLWANDILDDLSKYTKSIILILGNHCSRMNAYKETYAPPPYRPQFDISTRLNLRKRNIRMVAYNDWLDIGKVSVTHGMYHGTTAHKKHYDACGRSVIFSHIHHHEIKSFITRGESMFSMSLPAMCTLNPEYLRNRENNWSNGFGYLNHYNGKYNLGSLNVYDGQLITPMGKIYDGL